MPGKESRPGPRKDHHSRMVHPKHHDTYQHTGKAAGTVVCAKCGLLQHAGRWSSGDAPAGAERGLCPACERIRDKNPAGTIRLHADFLAFREEVVNMLRNVEKEERREHPLERIMALDDSDGGLTITTTGLHLARRITNALERRFHRQARLRYPPEQHVLFVDWEG